MPKKKPEIKTSIIPNLLIGMGILLIPIGICFGIVDDLMSHYQIPPEFCTKDDEVYQIIVAHAEQWMKQFGDNPSEFVTRFSTSSGKQYVVNAMRRLPQFFVQVREEIDEPFGLFGYAYGTTDFLDHRYGVRQLDQHIYCYQFKNL
jgi:hypothetical protein